MKVLKFLHKTHYGNERFYPDDEYTKMFIQSIGRKNQVTLTLDEIMNLKDLEVEMEFVKKSFEL